jgi:hypothetical protein
MALSDLAVFSEQLWSLTTEILDQEVELFNAATNNAIVLSARPFGGDYSERAFFQHIDGLVRRRDPYSSGAIGNKTLKQVVETMVKVGAGTPELHLAPSDFNWLKTDPSGAAAVWSEQLAKQVLADQLNVAIISAKAALLGEAATNVNDVTSGSDKKASYANLIDTAAKLGDRHGDIVCWIMRSEPWFAQIKDNLSNAQSLFSYGTVAVTADPLGKPMIVNDVPALVATGSPSLYYTLGLSAGGVMISTNDDFFANEDIRNGKENIEATYQAEWSFNVAVKGFTWDKATGGKAPNNTALANSANWDKIVTSHRDLAGVMLVSQ